MRDPLFDLLPIDEDASTRIDKLIMSRLPTETRPMNHVYSKIDAALTLLGKPSVGEITLPTFQDFFNHFKFRYFTYGELVESFKHAEHCKNPIPPSQYWPHAVLCVALADAMREVGGMTVWVKYAYRDAEFNKLVGGAGESDHTKFALDLVWKHKEPLTALEARDKALIKIVEPLWRLGWFEVSYGVGTSEPLIHIGVFCGKGQRRWTYRDGRVVGL